MSGHTVGGALDRAIAGGVPLRCTPSLDHDGFMSRALEDWRVRPAGFHSAGKPAENAFIESFDGRLRDECLNVHQLTSLEDLKLKIETWRIDYNQRRPYTARSDI